MKKNIDNLLLIAIENRLIKEKDKELYLFGITQSLSLAINIITICIIAFLLKAELEAVVFSGAYYYLRSYAGGIHAKSAKKCYILSIFLVIGSLMIINNVHVSIYYFVLIVVISSAIIFILAPVDSDNKRLDRLEREIFKKKARNILIVECSVFVISIASEFIIITKCITVAIANIAILLVVGAINNNLKTNLYY